MTYRNLICLLTAVSLLSSCTDISARTASFDPTNSLADTSDGGETKPLEVQSLLPDDDYDAEVVTVSDEPLNEEEAEFLKSLMFSGDSIMTGFHTYGFVPKSRVFAEGGVAARNYRLFDYNGGKDLTEEVTKANPGILVLSMGLNDVNMVTAEEFAESYGDIFKGFKAERVAVLSITPVMAESGFTDNERIRDFNRALEVTAAAYENVKYIDIYSPLSENGSLAPKFDAENGEGVHLMPNAYNVIARCIKENAVWRGE
jgi:hypothetical protein